MLIYAVYRETTYLEPSTNLNGEATISIQSVAYRMWRHRMNSHHTRQQVYKCSWLQSYASILLSTERERERKAFGFSCKDANKTVTINYRKNKEPI